MASRKIRTHLAVGDSRAPLGLRPKHLTKQEFASRVFRLMSDNGWNQSELARQATLVGKVEVTRDNISNYIRGRALPTPPKLKALAAAFDIGPDKLLPNYTESAIADDYPAFEMKVSANAPGVAWLQVNRLVRTSTATKIVELLENDDARADGKTGR